MKKEIYLSQILVFLSVINICSAGLLTWYPLWANAGSEYVPLSTVGQDGSEVVIIASGPGAFADPDYLVPTDPTNVEVPSLFVTYCVFSMEQSAYVQDFDCILWKKVVGNYERYDYDVGTGWIYHQKPGNLLTGDRFEQSLGWMYISNYPWIYGLEFGWRYVIESGIAWNSNAWWFFEPDFGWFWTTRDMYPIIYHKGLGWIIYSNR